MREPISGEEIWESLGAADDPKWEGFNFDSHLAMTLIHLTTHAQISKMSGERQAERTLYRLVWVKSGGERVNLVDEHCLTKEEADWFIALLERADPAQDVVKEGHTRRGRHRKRRVYLDDSGKVTWTTLRMLLRE